MSRRVPTGAAASLCGLLVACAPTSDSETRTALVVFAASSLSDAFTDIEQGFEKTRPDIDVRVSVAGSQVLRLQLEQGAQADVFASANEAHASTLNDAGLFGTAHPFARNEMVVVVPPDSPIATFDDLPKAKRVVVGRPDVPAGAYTRDILERLARNPESDIAARIETHIVSEEHNVRLVRAKVELGEADAAFVYRTDAHGRDALRVVSIPSALNARATYVVAVASASTQTVPAQAFVDYLGSAQGQATLVEHGFRGLPPEVE